MSEPRAVSMAAPARTVTEERRAKRSDPGILLSLLLVVGFWWLATGAIIAMQRNDVTRGIGFVAALLLAVYGVRLLTSTRDERTARSARLSFIGGALLWAFVNETFYGGWLVGLSTNTGDAAPGSLALALRAVSATLYNDLLGLAVVFAAFAMTRRAANRTGAWALLLFWITHQLARLNIFFGVENSAADLLPPHLTYLRDFFGPPRNSLLLMLSSIVLGVGTIVIWSRGRRHTDMDTLSARTRGVRLTGNGESVVQAARRRTRLPEAWTRPVSYRAQCWIALVGLGAFAASSVLDYRATGSIPFEKQVAIVLTICWGIDLTRGLWRKIPEQ